MDSTELKEGDRWYLPEWVGTSRPCRGNTTYTERMRKVGERAEAVYDNWPFESKPTYSLTVVTRRGSKYGHGYSAPIRQ